jgi:hypothetical protein
MPAVARLLTFVSILLAATASAQVSIFPPGPTSDDEVTLQVSDTCSARVTNVTRNGFDISVTLAQQGTCPSPPIEYPVHVALGELPPGQYRVRVEQNDFEPRTMTFYVRNAEPVPFALRPWAIPTNPQRHVVRIVPPDPRQLCGGSDCSSFRLEVGGVVYGIRDLDLPGGGIGFAAPPRAAGPVDVRITNAQGTFVIPAGLVYFDPGAPLDRSVFEPVLFPVLFGTDGVNGSRWRSEAVLSNPNEWAVMNLNSIEQIVCVTFPCGELLGPKGRKKFDGQGYPQGVALLVPRGESEDLAFSLRIRDISRDAESYGTTVPVVRERDLLRNTEVTLLDVPLDPRFRTKVRVYVFPDPVYYTGILPVGAAVQVGSDQPRAIALSRNCGGGGCDELPYYAELDLPAGGEGESADVYVELPADALGWAFASVTNNLTQQVTVVAPAGKGGRP